MEKSYFERKHERYLKNSKKSPETGLGCLGETLAIIVIIAILVAFAGSIIGWQLDQIPHITHAVEWPFLHLKLVLLFVVVAAVIIVLVAWRRDGEFL